MKQYKYKINGNLYNVTVGDVEDNIANVEVNGTYYSVELDKPATVGAPAIERPAASVAASAPASKPAVSAPKPVSPVAKPASKPSAPAVKPVAAKPSASASGVKSPLPGVILDIKVNVGDEVKKGQTVVILEAMKMENNINATRDGKVSAIKVNKGDSVLEGTDLIIIE